ncbi:MAG: NupC/NupG family nucleoside CNT transporter, partial [Myxococcales bacterium]|nr:NupC/NupG family nucleoside CNT transporter [Myxococcales bacterium]
MEPQSPATAAASAAAKTIQITSDLDTPISARLISVLGLFVMIAIAWAMSTDRKKVPWRIMAWGIGLQVALGFVVLRTDLGRKSFVYLKDAFTALLEYYKAGADMVLGGIATDRPFVFILAVLPTIIFFSSLMAVLYHLRIMQALVGGVAWLMRRTMGTSGAESLSAAGNIFVGQTEAPLLIRPFVEKMTLSELMAVMVGGFATVAGSVFAVYVGLLQDSFPDIAGHLLTASVMSAPAALVIAKIMVPETEVSETAEGGAQAGKSEYSNLIDAAATGAADGLKLAMNVAAMLLAFVALIALANGLLAFVGGWFGHGDITIQGILGKLLSPLAWIMGVAWEDAQTVGSLLGTKTVVNEFVAYLDLTTALKAGQINDPRSVVIATYALCGFANFGSIAIQIGGISAIAPGRRKDLAKLGLKAMIGGTLASLLTAS